jgi:type I restriction enzyme, S subunit
VDEAIEQTEALVQKWQQMKAGLMHDLFTRGVTAAGQLRPTRTQAPQLYKNSPLGWIPKEWDTVRLDKSDISIIDGDRGENYPQGHELLDSGYCIFLSATNVTDRGFRFDQLQFISRDKDQSLGTGKLVRGDIVITTRGTVGNIAFFDDQVPFAEIRINSGMIILRSDQHGLTQDFLYCSFANHIFPQEFKRVVSGSAQPQLPIKDLKRFHCLIPSPTEQEQLMAMANSVESYILSEEDRLLKLRAQKQGLMQDLLTGRVPVRVAGRAG